MTLNSLDVAPINTRELEQREQYQIQKQHELQLQQQQLDEKTLKKKAKAEKNVAKTQKKAEKAKLKAEKAKKQVQKAQQKAEKTQKQAEKAQKDAEKAQKELEKFTQPIVKEVSQASVSTVATIQLPEGPAPESAAMPMGIVLSVCASLLVCFGSAWLYRRTLSHTA